MTIRVQIGEDAGGIRQWAELDGYRTHAPPGDAAFRLARVLIKSGHDPNEPYETARGDKVSMRFPTLRFAASLTVEDPSSGRGMRFVKWKPGPHGGEDE